MNSFKLFSVLVLSLVFFVTFGLSGPITTGSETELDKSLIENIEVVDRAKKESSAELIRDRRHILRKKLFGHHGGYGGGGCGSCGCGGCNNNYGGGHYGGGGGSFAGASAGAGSFGGGGHGGNGAQAGSQAASFSVGGFSASIASSFANAGSRGGGGGGFFDY